MSARRSRAETAPHAPTPQTLTDWRRGTMNARVWVASRESIGSRISTSAPVGRVRMAQRAATTPWHPVAVYGAMAHLPRPRRPTPAKSGVRAHRVSAPLPPVAVYVTLARLLSPHRPTVAKSGVQTHRVTTPWPPMAVYGVLARLLRPRRPTMAIFCLARRLGTQWLPTAGPRVRALYVHPHWPALTV